jgi:ribonuclease HI
MSFYAIAHGKTQAIVNTWPECRDLTEGFSGSVYKKFDNREDAEMFLIQSTLLMKPVSKQTAKEPKQSKATKTSTKAIVEIEASTFVPDYYVYTDGSCSNNGSRHAAAGVGIYFGEHDPRNVSQRVEGKQTNNTAELGAIHHLYNLIEPDIQQGKRIAVVSDSEYAIRCATTYGAKQAKAGWPAIPNRDLVKAIYEAYSDKPKVQFVHIMAHTEKTDVHSLGNDGADRLANMAIGLEHCPYSGATPQRTAAPRQKHLYLDVPYARKDEAKGMGARWDPSKKKWYIEPDAANRTAVLAKFPAA